MFRGPPQQQCRRQKLFTQASLANVSLHPLCPGCSHDVFSLPPLFFFFLREGKVETEVQSKACISVSVCYLAARANWVSLRHWFDAGPCWVQQNFKKNTPEVNCRCLDWTKRWYVTQENCWSPESGASEKVSSAAVMPRQCEAAQVNMGHAVPRPAPGQDDSRRWLRTQVRRNRSTSHSRRQLRPGVN